jgi:hypothetical protein
MFLGKILGTFCGVLDPDSRQAKVSKKQEKNKEISCLRSSQLGWRLS